MAPAPPLAELIASVEADAPSPDPLAALATASATAAELTDTSDALVGHFVDRCRAAGHTWAEISESLGVTKQAAHKRYSPLPRELSRWTERAKGALAASLDAARAFGHSHVGTEHLLLGLFPPGGIGAQLLAESGLTEEAVATKVLEHTQRGTTGPAEPPFTPRAAEVFGTALSEALSMGHNYIGTEHLVLALFAHEDTLGAQILRDAGATHADYKQKIVTLLSGFMK
ncbi:MAG: Clp protease N-terminal domain-containing protein [Acidimicrobiales bacterium]